MSLIERAIRERIVLVGVTLPPAHLDDTESSLDRLSLLVDTAGAEEAARIVTRRDRPDPAMFLGKGKAEERERCASRSTPTPSCSTTSSRRRSSTTSRSRSADRDRSHRGDPRHLRSERPHPRRQGPGRAAAMLRYRLPRLRRGRAGGLSQQAGGIGTRGPGERSSRPIVVACSDASPSSNRISSGSSKTRGTSNARPARGAD